METMRQPLTGPIDFLPSVRVSNVPPHLVDAIVADIVRRYPPGTVVDVSEVHDDTCGAPEGGRCGCPTVDLAVKPNWGGDCGIPGPYPQLMCMN